MDTALRIVEQLPLAAAVVAGIGVPGGIAVRNQRPVAHRHRVRQRRIQADPYMQAALRTQAHHDDGIRRGDEICGLTGTPVPEIGGARHGRRQVEFPVVIADFSSVQVAYPERAERHVRFAEMALDLPLQALRGTIIPVREGLADQRNRLRSVRTDAVQQVGVRCAAVRLSRP